jgi:phosphoglycolate phosphatase
MTAARCQAVLFDLDGTLVDSAPDLAGAANDLRAPRLPAFVRALRPMVGRGHAAWSAQHRRQAREPD